MIPAPPRLSDVRHACPRCGVCEAAHPEACPIEPEQWRSDYATIARLLRANQRARREARAAAARRGVTAVIRTRRLTGAAAWLALAARAPEMLAGAR